MEFTKGRMTKPNVWDKARKLELVRVSGTHPWEEPSTIDPGVNFFVAMLEQLGLRTTWSCEGHPNGFYISFQASERMTRKIHECGFFNIEIERGRDCWSVRDNVLVPSDRHGKNVHVNHLRWAAEAWEEGLGKLDFRRVRRNHGLRKKVSKC